MRNPIRLALLLCLIVSGARAGGSRAVPQPPADRAYTLPVGSVAPDFEVRDASGKTRRLSEFRGKVVVLDFWATWCGPCKLALPHLASIARDTRAQLPRGRPDRDGLQARRPRALTR